MAKPTERQIKAIQCCRQFLDYLETSNDIHSPSHVTDADEAFHNMDDIWEDDDDPEFEFKASKYLKAESALAGLWVAIADLDKCHIRAEQQKNFRP